VALLEGYCQGGEAVLKEYSRGGREIARRSESGMEEKIMKKREAQHGFDTLQYSIL